MTGRPTPNQRSAVEVVLDSSLDLQRLPRARINNSHTTFAYHIPDHSKKNQKSSYTGIIPVNVEHCLARPWPSSAQAKKVKISQGFHSLGAGDQERSYFGAIRLVSSSIDYEPPSRTLSRSGDHGQVCSALSPHDTTQNTHG